MREDVESAYLDITEYTGQSLTGPRDLISRRVVCSNPQITISEAAAGAALANGANLAAKVPAPKFKLSDSQHKSGSYAQFEGRIGFASAFPPYELGRWGEHNTPTVLHASRSRWWQQWTKWFDHPAYCRAVRTAQKWYNESLQKYQHRKFNSVILRKSKRRFGRYGADFHATGLKWTDWCLQ